MVKLKDIKTIAIQFINPLLGDVSEQLLSFPISVFNLPDSKLKELIGKFLFIQYNNLRTSSYHICS